MFHSPHIIEIFQARKNRKVFENLCRLVLQENLRKNFLINFLPSGLLKVQIYQYSHCDYDIIDKQWFPALLTVLESVENTAQKMRFSIKDFFSKCNQIRRKLRVWSHLLKKSLMETFIFLCSAWATCMHDIMCPFTLNKYGEPFVFAIIMFK